MKNLQMIDRTEISTFLKEINKKDFEPISNEKEIKLISRIKNDNDEVARTQLLNVNLRFVVSVAKQYQNQYINISDLINEGLIGMNDAIDNFDASKGFKFITYAVQHIRKAMYNYIIENGKLVRMPANIINDYNKCKREMQKIEQQEQRNVDITEVYENSEYFTKNHSSIDKPMNDDNENTITTIYENPNSEKPDEELKKSDTEKIVNNALKILTQKEQYVIKQLFGINESYPKVIDEIAKDLNLTRERVRQIKEKALKRIRMSSNNNILKQYC
jgi:RNA polymerase primary sigma factor